MKHDYVGSFGLSPKRKARPDILTIVTWQQSMEVTTSIPVWASEIGTTIMQSQNILLKYSLRNFPPCVQKCPFC